MGAPNAAAFPPPDVGGEAETVASIIVEDLTPDRIVYADSTKKLASVANLASWVAGTANQVTVANDGDGTITLSLPQNIHTAATPQFAGATFTGSLAFSGDNTHDLTAVGSRPRDVYAGRQFLSADGNAGAPGWSFSGAPTWGVHRDNGLGLVFDIGGTGYTSVATDGVTVVSSAKYSWTSGLIGAAQDLSISRVSAGTGKVTNGSSACEWRVHGDGTKYVAIYHNGTDSYIDSASGLLVLQVQAAAQLIWDGTKFFGSDNARDLGGSSNTWRYLYTGTQIRANYGTAAAPAYSAAAQTDKGVYFGTNYGAFSIGGVGKAIWFDTGYSLASTVSLGWLDGTVETGNTDLRLWRDAAGVLGQRNGVNAQEHRTYNTYTSSTNYETFAVRWAGNDCYLITEKGSGGGTARQLRLGADGTARWDIATSGHLLASFDNTNDIGAPSATRPRSGYFGTSISVGTNPASVGSIRIQNQGSIQGRNAANSADLTLLSVNASDQLALPLCGNQLGTSGTWGIFGTTPVSAKTGWGTATGTATRTTFATTTVTLEELAQRVKALIDDLHQTAGYGLLRT